MQTQDLTDVQREIKNWGHNNYFGNCILKVFEKIKRL